MEVREEEALPRMASEAMPRRRCLGGERERIFSSPLSSDAKCLLGMHGLLDTNLVMHSVLGDA